MNSIRSALIQPRGRPSGFQNTVPSLLCDPTMPMPLPNADPPAAPTRRFSRVGQSKWHSLVESVANVGIGYLVGLMSQLLIFPMFNIHVAFAVNLQISLWFTVVGVLRTYFLRRVFNRWHLAGRE